MYLISSVRVASLIPLIRLPRSTGEFSYTIPDTITVQVGQIVEAPFRGRTLLGLVSAVNDTGPVGITLKPLKKIITTAPIVSEQHLALWQIAAKRYGVHPGLIARMGLPPLKKTKLAKVTLPPLSLAGPARSSHTNHHWYSNPTEWQHFITASVQHKVAFIFPEKYQLEQARARLSPDLLAKTVVWDSDQSEKEQFANWFKIRNGEFTLLLGTRSAIFLPLLGAVRTVVLDFASSTNHKHWDQQPRFHTHDVATWLAELGEVEIKLSGPSPTLAAWRDHATTIPALNATVVHFTSEPGNTSLLARPLLENIKAAASTQAGDIICILNRRGLATTIVCRDCGFVADCPQCQIPYMYEGSKKQLACRLCGHTAPRLSGCPKCRSPLLALRGGGTERVAEELRVALAGTGYSIYIVDKESDIIPEATGPRCLIGTDALMARLDFARVIMAMVLDTDASLARAEFTATMHAWNRLADLRFWLPPTTPLYVQTRKSDHSFYQSLSQPSTLYQTELTTRQALHYPPFIFLTRFLCSGATEAAAITAAQILKNKLTKEPKNRIVQGPIPLVPVLARGEYWAAVLVRFDNPPWDALEHAISQTNANTIIDPNPVSLFSLS